MSESNEHEFDPRLLDLHLGHLSEAEKVRLRTQIASDPRLAEQDETLRGALRLLAAATDEAAPSDLVARTMARVNAAGPVPRVIRPTDELTVALEQRPERVIRLGKLREIVAVAALIVLAVGVGVPSLRYMHERQQRMGCSWNLAQLGRGLQQYAGAYNASLPFVGWDDRSTWQPTVAPGMVNVPNRRHVYPLLRRAYVTDPRVFVCPSQHDVPMPSDQVQARNDFLEDRNVSYAYQNMSGVRPSTNDDPGLPILADDNPLFSEGRPLFDLSRLKPGSPAESNSDAHGRAGQNVLTLDGHVIWTKTPKCGVNGDNIWILQKVVEYTGREGPEKSTDSHLLK